MEGYINLKTLTLDELVGVVNLYPWFGNARKELCSRLMAMGDDETAMAALADASFYVSSRKSLVKLYRERRHADCADRDMDNILKSYISGQQEKTRQEENGRPVVVVSGDYFSQAQYARVRQKEDDSLRRFVSSDADVPVPDIESGFDMDFCTETLAQVYAEQGYYQQAKDIYSKLILAYPEKNAYFAALIEKLGSEN